MADNYIIEMKNVTKTFPGIIANDNVSLGIRKGEIFAILGENGAGKSTLMSILFGMYQPDSGEIFVRGKKENINSPSYATKLNIGMVHQHFKLVSNYTIAENIILGIEPKRRLAGFLPVVDIKGTNEKVSKLSKEYGLEVNPKDKIENINVSIQQRVEILKMLYREAEILIFDEPTAVLTPQEIDFLLQIIKGLRDSGKTIILITHKLEEIKQVADRCCILNRGKLIDILDVSVTSTKTMANLMVGREVEFESNKTEPKFGKTVLDVKNLTVKNAEGFPIVKNVNFSIREGEIFAIAGVSGNGQVEIANSIAGMLECEGNILLNGEDVRDKSIRKRTDLGISYIPEDRQNVGLILDFDLAKNICLKKYYKEPFCKNGLLNHGKFYEYGEKLISKYDIRSGQGTNTQTRSMSGGNQQKAIIAREIENNSPFTIFVQPTRGLDIGAIENIHKQILELRDKGKAILLISLELEEIMNLADTIGVIYSGEIQKIADTSTLTTNDVGQYMMGVKNDEKFAE